MVIFHSYVKLPEGSPLCYLCYLFNLFLALASGIPAYGNRLEVRQQDSLQYTAWKTLNNCYKGHIIKRHSHRMPRCFYTPPLMVVSFLFLSCMSGHLTKLSPARNTPPVPTEGTDASSRRCRYLVSVWVPLGNQAAPLIPRYGSGMGQNCGPKERIDFSPVFTFHSARGHAACMQGSTA